MEVIADEQHSAGHFRPIQGMAGNPAQQATAQLLRFARHDGPCRIVCRVHVVPVWGTLDFLGRMDHAAGASRAVYRLHVRQSYGQGGSQTIRSPGRFMRCHASPSDYTLPLPDRGNHYGSSPVSTPTLGVNGDAASGCLGCHMRVHYKPLYIATIGIGLNRSAVVVCWRA